MLLLVAVVSLLVLHAWVRPWVAVAVPVAVGLVTGLLDADEALDAVRSTRLVVAFLLVAFQRSLPGSRGCCSSQRGSVRPCLVP